MGEKKTFGQWLRHQRRELDLTQLELSQRVGCAPITIRKIEADEMRPSKQLAELLMEQLGIPVEERENYIRFARGGELAAPVAVTGPRHNLPHPVSSFIGREREIEEIKRLMVSSRLVTLTGAGGSGKTRLALEAAGQVIDQFPEGAWFVGLAPLSESTFVTQTIAIALGMREDSNRPLVQTLADYLYTKKLLLLFDNCEHLISECAQVVDILLHSCPQLNILATSREALGIEGEEQYYVPTLSLPEAGRTISLKRLNQAESVRLFVNRAALVQSTFTMTTANARSIVKICQRLDGMPLAIELAAARVKLLTVDHIAERLDDRFNLLTSGSRTTLPRQQTLRATFDWSYDLLSGSSRGLFRRLSVFAGGFGQDAAEAVCADEDLARDAVLTELSRLVDRSLVEVLKDGKEERYWMLETIRLYAYERLQESGEERRYRDQHLKYFSEWTEQVEPRLRGPEQTTWWDRMELEHDNIRSALGWSLRGGDVQWGLKLAGAAFWFWYPRSYWREGYKWLRDILTRIPNQGWTPTRAKALVAGGFLAMEMSTDDDVKGWFEESLEYWREVGDKWWTAYTLLCIGWYFLNARDAGSARASFGEAVAYARELGDKWIMGYSLRCLGAAVERFDYAAARPILEEGLSLLQAVGDHSALAETLVQLYTVAWGQRDYVQAAMFAEACLVIFRKIGTREFIAGSLVDLALAKLGQGNCRGAAELCRECLRECMALSENMGYKYPIVGALLGLGGVAGVESQPQRSAILLAAAESLLNSIGTTMATWPYMLAEYERFIATTRAQLDETEFTKALEKGRAMTVEQAMKYAMEESRDG